MENPAPEFEGLSIVLRGDFNPKILQPAWFASQKLIREEEAEKVELRFIHHDICDFSLEWLQLQVVDDRFVASTTKPPYYELLRDLVLGTFRILRHTPLRLMGINRDMHFKMDSQETWHGIGHRLAPKELWKDILRDPGLRSLTMEGVRPDNFKGYIRVKVEPSVKVKPFGVYFEVNDHFEVKEADAKLVGADEIMNLLQQCWKDSVSRSDKIIDYLLKTK